VLACPWSALEPGCAVAFAVIGNFVFCTTAWCAVARLEDP
jgi:hypothetical protein